MFETLKNLLFKRNPINVIPKEDCTIRELNDSDYEKYLKLINQFRPTAFTQEEYKDAFNIIKKNSTIWVVDYNDELIGTATIIYECKFIRNIVKLAHVEDVCVDKSFRSRGIGNILMKYIVNEAREKNCYKIILDCDENLENFYKRSGLEKKGIQMAKYFIE